MIKGTCKWKKSVLKNAFKNTYKIFMHLYLYSDINDWTYTSYILWSAKAGSAVPSCCLSFPLWISYCCSTACFHFLCSELVQEKVGNKRVTYGAGMCFLLSWITVRWSLFWPLSGCQLVRESQSWLGSKLWKPELDMWHCCNFLVFTLHALMS